jgi:hypothetical protein
VRAAAAASNLGAAMRQSGAQAVPNAAPKAMPGSSGGATIAGAHEPMSNPTAPVKTPLGHQELRRRTQGLGQRHRTVLLLVDGRRSLADVLSMAHQAGAGTSYFEELVRLGMIELPARLLPAQPEAPVEPQVDALEAAAAPAAEVQVAPAEAGPIEHGQDMSPPVSPAVPEAANADAEPGAEIRPADNDALDEVRRLLIDTLRRDTLLQRVLAPARVRAAHTQEALIGLVWDIERERAHARRKRGQLLNLQRARELLGMGNTLVAEDSLPWTPPGP